jgi:magnesium chelatase subunit I
MNEIEKDEFSMSSPPEAAPTVRSLRELIDRVTGRGFLPPQTVEPAGLAETLPLALINPAVGGVLLIGPRGTGKTTAVRSLVDLLPSVPRSLCYYGCLPEDVEQGGIDAVCPDCARKFALGEPLAKTDRVRLVELPLNSSLDDVIGGIDERAALHDRMRLRRGLLNQADRNLLYVDEVNLLSNEVVDALLDAAAQGSYTVRRGPLSASYWSRFVLIGSMNPEEGRLRPQIMDRFGLRVVVHGLKAAEERLEAYRRVQAFGMSPRRVVANFAQTTQLAREEIQSARELLPKVHLSEEVAQLGLELTSRLKLDSLRAEITLFEAARAYAAADARSRVAPADLQVVAPMALRLRRSDYIKEYFNHQQVEDEELVSALDEIIPS